MDTYEWVLGNKETTFVQDNKFWKYLSEKAYPLTKGTLRIPISIEPFLIERKKYTDLTAELECFMSAARKIADAYYTDKRIQDVLAIDEKERTLIDASKNKNTAGVIRLDLFYAETPRVVEINTDYPDGFFMHDITASTMRDLFPDSLQIELKNHALLFSDLLLSEGATKDMHVFVGYDKGRFFIDEFYVTKNRLAELGWKNISVGAFEDLSFKYGSFYFNETKVDVLRRGSELSKIRKIPDFIPHLLEAEKNGLIVVNNFKMRLLGYKSLMAALWDERLHEYLTPAEINAIQKILPRTYKLDSQKINKTKLIAEKNTWVVKPIDLAEGTDVFVGAGMSDTDWNTALNRAYINPTKWIAQEKVIIPETTFNLVEDNHSKITSYTRRYDCNPHIILQKDRVDIGNILVRFSSSHVVNVAQGGGITYAFPFEKNV